MSIARELAEFLTGTIGERAPVASGRSCGDADRQHACQRGDRRGTRIRRRSSATSRGSAAGGPQASLWFDAGPRLPVAEAAQVNAVMSDAAASDDSDLRNIVHAGTTLAATALARRRAYRRRRRGCADRDRPRLRGSRTHRRSDHTGLSRSRVSRLPRRDLRAARSPPGGCCSWTRRGWRRRSRCRRPRSAGLRRPRRIPASRANIMPGWRQCLASTRRSRHSAGTRPRSSILEKPVKGFFEALRRRRWRRGRRDRDPRSRANPGTSSPTWRSSWCRAVTPTMRSPRPPPTRRARADICAGGVESITVSRPGITALTGPLHPTDLIGMAHSPAYFVAAGVADRGFSWVMRRPQRSAIRSSTG